MADSKTAGFDMVVQVGEGELNDQVAIQFAAGALPTTVVSNVNASGIVGTATLNFNTPTLDLDTSVARGVRVSMPFINSQFAMTVPAVLTVAPLGGTVLIVHPAGIITSGSTQTAALDFTSGTPTVTVTFDAASAALLAPLLAAVGMTQAQVEALFATQFAIVLQSQILNFPLSPPITTTSDSDPTTIAGMEVGTINQSSGLDALVFGLRMSSQTGGDIDDVDEVLISDSGDVVLLIGNDWLLREMVRPALEDALSGENFDDPCVQAPGDVATLDGNEVRNTRAFINGNRIQVTGDIRREGTGWTATGSFSFFIDLSLDSSGNIVIDATEPDVDVDVNLAWWVYVAGVLTAGLILGWIAAGVALLVILLVDAIADGIADGIATRLMGQSLDANVDSQIPFGPLGSGLVIDSILLDDLTLHGDPIYSEEMPVKSSGSSDLDPGQYVNLDNGNVSSTARSGSDLVWSTGYQIQPYGSAQIARTTRAYSSLSQPDLEKLAYSTSAIPMSDIPWDLPWPYPESELVFAVHTSDGRYAKCGASLDTDLDLDLRWTTYDRPLPSLDIAGRWEKSAEELISSENVYATSEKRRWLPGFEAMGKTFEGRWIGERGRVLGVSETWAYAWTGYFAAAPTLLPFPIDYQWCLCGRVLKGEGDITIDGQTIHYVADAGKVTVTTQLGMNLDCELCLSAIDAYGQEHFVCVEVTRAGEYSMGRVPEERTHAIVPITPDLMTLPRIPRPPEPKPGSTPGPKARLTTADLVDALERGGR